MSSGDPAPTGEHDDPASLDTGAVRSKTESEEGGVPTTESIATGAANITIEETQDQEKDMEKKVHVAPRDSKGWDGKLRIDKKALQGEEVPADGAHSEAEESEAEDEGPPPEQISADEDLLDDVPEDETEIDLVHCRISSIPALRLERFTKLQVSSPPLVLPTQS
jgi:protein phosphatase 1 regulatory subunit 7